ncbi:MAG: class I SAM-dependent methyltransferase [Symploca sp. SIO2E6]|nr:class I SAM-dependent methyltransferase [Symploca sp. SIO2E6]
MENQASDIWEKVRQQFDTGPYPRTPLETSPKDNPGLLYIHNLVTAYYLRNQQVIETAGKVILDAGCGTGYKSLVLAQANPGAKIIGIDLSEASVNLAKERLKYHGVEDAEFQVLAIEDLHQLPYQFDYINCDEVLYLFPEPAVGLKAMKSVLKEGGIIRTNLHSYLQRVQYFRAQEVFKMMGLMDDNPRELEIESVRDTMKALKDQVMLKKFTWQSKHETDEGWFLMNYLLQGDKGYTIPEMFSALRAAELEFINMVNWWQWDLMALFKEPDNLPVFLGMSLPETSLEEQLHLFELLHPIHRLLDFWCGHPHQAQLLIPVPEWTNSDWLAAKVYLHPQLKTAAVKEELSRCITQPKPFEIGKYMPIAGEQFIVDSAIAAGILLPLWEEAQSIQQLVERWQKLRPLNPVTLAPSTDEGAMKIIQQVLKGLADCDYILLECSS